SLVFFDGRLNSAKYIDILENNLAVALEKFPAQQSNKIWYQQDNARPHVSAKAENGFNSKSSSEYNGKHLIYSRSKTIKI
ncbi:unnamed protein product, partial [Rotaria magnacalcarata]